MRAGKVQPTAEGAAVAVSKVKEVVLRSAENDQGANRFCFEKHTRSRFHDNFLCTRRRCSAKLDYLGTNRSNNASRVSVSLSAPYLSRVHFNVRAVGRVTVHSSGSTPLNIKHVNPLTRKIGSCTQVGVSREHPKRRSATTAPLPSIAPTGCDSTSGTGTRKLNPVHTLSGRV